MAKIYENPPCSQPNSLLILMLTARDEIEDKVQGLDAGADDYLIKPFSTSELLARVRALARRSPQFQTQNLQVGNLILDYSTSSISIQNTVIPLTAKEFQILEYFLQHPLSQILTREQIIEQIMLWQPKCDY